MTCECEYDDAVYDELQRSIENVNAQMDVVGWRFEFGGCSRAGGGEVKRGNGVEKEEKVEKEGVETEGKEKVVEKGKENGTKREDKPRRGLRGVLRRLLCF
ncbi:hypothetical protein CC1G_07488 [Coprinopsis cinerea okayama7|uniref:Uncharacterized protein n=1 Tax=Coprinopsis cinerea (strain Okayama-7 / 130 / ATCC MYA-4618 / FGSC 9003) TaxID=240176 RepID=A8NBB8_COPC7|nr:hypothetical protein CC1G_07488 [Coprinopsis cinerea okayama7\|eukprot:XP_001832117.2 hypothetical protein CC1G_07488 [Coprinopsis cinerea okayama7\